MATALVFAADTLVRFRNGRILVHTTSGRLPAFETDQPMLIGWICQFAEPTSADAALATLPPNDRPGAAQIVDYLSRSGVLVPATAPESRERAPNAAADLTRNHLRLLARTVYDLACDVIGLGPEQAERALRPTPAWAWSGACWPRLRRSTACAASCCRCAARDSRTSSRGWASTPRPATCNCTSGAAAGTCRAGSTSTSTRRRSR